MRNGAGVCPPRRKYGQDACAPMFTRCYAPRAWISDAKTQPWPVLAHTAAKTSSPRPTKSSRAIPQRSRGEVLRAQPVGTKSPGAWTTKATYTTHLRPRSRPSSPSARPFTGRVCAVLSSNRAKALRFSPEPLARWRLSTTPAISQTSPSISARVSADMAFFMGATRCGHRTPFPRAHWHRVARVCIIPCTRWERVPFWHRAGTESPPAEVRR